MKAFCFDTETTDLISNVARDLKKQPYIIEFYGCVVEDGEIIHEIDFLCDPGIEISEQVQKITGIKPSDLAGKPRFAAHIDEISEVIGRCDTIVAHNLYYDLHVLGVELMRANRQIAIPPRKICTVESTEHLSGYRLSLSALHEELFGEGFDDAHRAKHDVQAMVRCLNELVQRGEI